MRLSLKLIVCSFLSLLISVSLLQPTQAKPQDPSAICRDNTFSYSANRSGTCSGHGGVLEWCPCKQFQTKNESGNIKYRVRGDCLKPEEDLIEIIEDETTSCSLFVVASTTNRSRIFTLQIFDEENEDWINEDTVRANPKGGALLQIEDIWTPDGECYDDWSFLYRIVSEKIGSKKYLESNEIQVDFYSSCSSDW